MSKSIDTRALATRILQKVIVNQRPFHPGLIQSLAPDLAKPHLAFVCHLCFCVLRHYFLLESIYQKLLDKPLRSKDFDVKMLIFVGLAQLYYCQTPAYAAIHETVTAAKKLKKPWAQGLVNAVLRAAPSDLSSYTSHSCWLQQQIALAWPDCANEIHQANLEHPVMTLRVNNQKTHTKEYIALLKEQGVTAHLHPYAPDAVQLEKPCDVDCLPGFHQGFVSVQDASAQIAARLLDLKPNLSVLDACAAPGGKTAHCLELFPNLKLFALEKEPSRYTRLTHTLHRLELKATCIIEDATTQTWWNKQCFDRILLDAPCSGSGVIRRHPDILLHRQANDLDQLLSLQSKLLLNLWPMLKPGGILLYATCSILPQENVKQVQAFLASHQDAKEWPIIDTWGRKEVVGRQILPSLTHQMDGFYYARIMKVSNQ